MKDALEMHLRRHSMEDNEYFEILDSLTFVEYGRSHLAQPGPRSGIERRTFHDLKKETIKERTDEVKQKNLNQEININL